MKEQIARFLEHAEDALDDAGFQTKSARRLTIRVGQIPERWYLARPNPSLF